MYANITALKYTATFVREGLLKSPADGGTTTKKKKEKKKVPRPASIGSLIVPLDYKPSALDQPATNPVWHTCKKSWPYTVVVFR